MGSNVIIPPQTDLYRSLQQAARERKQVFMTGIPGVGKSLYVQQLLLLAQEAGRTVHLLQYDVVRTVFERHPRFIEKYPESAGVTHPMIRKGVGIWARQAILKWSNKFGGDEHILIGETPLIGGRLIELVQPMDDSAEPLLAGDSTLFMIPIPSKRIRDKIVAKRQETIANPRHQKEKMDAQISVLRQLWEDVHQVAVMLGLADPLPSATAAIPYDPDAYEAVYRHLCRHRQTKPLRIDIELNPTGSVYDMPYVPNEVRGTADHAAAIITELERQYTTAEIARLVEKWAD